MLADQPLYLQKLERLEVYKNISRDNFNKIVWKSP